jgi:hypothetical protein
VVLPGGAAPNFESGIVDNDERLALELDGDFYAALNLQAARDRDNRAALTRAGVRIVAADAAYRSITVARRV